MDLLKKLLLTLFLFAFAKCQSETLTFTNTLTSPKQVGSTFSIQWSHSYQVSSNVNVDLYGSNTKIRNILENELSSNSSSNSRTLTTSSVVDGTDYKIRVVSVSNSSIFTESNTFTISNDVSSTITYTGPTSLNVGQTYTLSWTNPSQPYRVDLYSGSGNGVYVSTIVDRTSSASYSWTVPSNLVVGTYQFKIMRIAFPDVFGTGTITVSTANSRSLGYSAPATGYVAFNGENLAISYTRSGLAASETVKLDLYNTTDFVMNIAQGVTATTYNWLLPKTLSDSRVYRIRVTHESISSVSAFGGSFEVRPAIEDGSTSGFINVTTSEYAINFKKAYRLNNPGNCWELYVERMSTNTNDQLRIYDGPDDLAPALDTLSGSAVPQGKKIQSSGSYLYAKFSVITASTGFVLVRYNSIPCSVPSFNFITPSAIASYTVGDSISISWLEKGNIFYSHILFRKGAEVIALVSDNAVSPVSYTLPTNLVYGTDYNFLISSIDPSFPSQTVQFPVYPVKSLTFINPSTANTVYSRGQNVLAQWLSIGNFDVVDVSLRKGATIIQTQIVSSPHNVGGSFNFSISNTSALGNDYSFRVNNGSTIAISPSFSVEAPCDADRTISTLGGSGSINLASTEYIYNERCRTTIVSSVRQCIRVQFTTFSLATGDYLRVYEGDQTQSTIIKELAWNATDSTSFIFSSGYAITVRLQTTTNALGNGYAFNYVGVTCPSTLDILTPSGNSLWAKQQPAGTYVIQWNSTQIGDRVKIDLADVGSNYNVSISTLAANVSSAQGFFTAFTLPSTLVDYRNYIIRISSVVVPNYFSENSFTALPTTASRIIVNSPNHLTKVNRRGSLVVSWTSSGVLASQNVKIELYAGTEFKQILANNVNSTLGTNTYTIQDAILTSERYRVYVTATTDSGMSGESPLYLINQNEVATISITSPLANELIQQFIQKTITWTKTGLADNVNLLLYSGGVFVKTIASNINATSGAYNYTYVDNVGPYTLYIVRAEGLDVLGTQSFNLVGSISQSIIVLQPYGEESLSIEGASQLVQWSWKGLVERVNVELLFKSTVVDTLGSNITNTGFLTWNLPYNTLPYGVDYRIRVSETTNTTNSGVGSPFTITVVSPEKITVTNPPQAIQTWTLGSTQNIQWIYPFGTPTISTLLNIELYSGQRLYRKIAHEIKATLTSFSWTVPTDLETDKPYRLIIFASRSRSVLGGSPKFWLRSQLTSVSVTGNSNMFLGNYYPVSWVGNAPFNFDVNLHDNNNNKLWNVAKKVTSTSYQFYPPTSLAFDNSTTYKIKVNEIAHTGFIGESTALTKQPLCAGIQIQDNAGTVSLVGRLGNVRCSYVFTNPSNLCYYFKVSTVANFDYRNDAIEFYDGQDASGIKFAQFRGFAVDSVYLMKSVTPKSYVTFKTGSSSTQSHTLLYRTVECSNPSVFVETPRGAEENGQFPIRWNSRHFQATFATVQLLRAVDDAVFFSTLVENNGYHLGSAISVTDQVDLYVKVTLRSDQSGRSWSGRSDVFTLLGDVTILQPLFHTTTVLQAGSSMTVQWSNTLDNQASTAFFFGVNGQNYTLISQIAISTGSVVTVSYTIPSNVAIYESFVVRIVPSNPALYKLPFYQTSNFQVRRPTQLVNQLIAPSPSSKLVAGETHNIRWGTIGEYTEVTIDLLFSNGTYIERIAQNVANTGVLAWTVPSKYTNTINTYQMKISPARLINVPSYSATSNFNFFTRCEQIFSASTSTFIYNPSTGESSECILILNPSNAKCINTQLAINIDVNDRLVVYNGNTTLSPILETITGPAVVTKYYQSYSQISYWLKADATQTATQVTHTYNTNCDVKLDVHSPSRFGSYKVGTTQNIQYTHILNSTTLMDVTLHKGGSDTPSAIVASNFVAGPEYDGRISWSIPANLIPGIDYFLRFTQLPTVQAITSSQNLVLTDSHQFSLSTTDPKFTITAPAAFSTLFIGQPQTLSWSTNGIAVANVNVDLYSGGKSLFVLRIASNVANTGSLSYTVPTYVQPGLDYHIVVSNALNVQELGVSNSVIFDEANTGTITLTSQPPSTTTTSNQFTLTFTKSSDIPYTDVALYSSDWPVQTIASRFLGTVLNVTIFKPATDYKIAIINGLNVNVRTLSNQFTVTEGADVATPAIFVGSPNVGDTFISQESQQTTNIKWLWSGSVANVNIELFHSTNSSSGAIKVADIASNIENLGYYSWSIPSNLMRSNRYVVKVTNVANAAVFHISGEFTITSQISNSIGFYAVISSIAQGTYMEIKWNPDGQAKFVDLYLASERYVYQLIARAVPNDGSYLWTTPVNVALLAVQVVVVPYGTETSLGVSPIMQIQDQTFQGFTVSLSTIYSSFGNPQYSSVAIGNNYTISWTINVNTIIRLHNITQVHIDLHENGGNLVQPIACNVSAGTLQSSVISGSFTWFPKKTNLKLDVVNLVDLSKDYQIKIYTANTPGIRGLSSSFKVREQTLLTSTCGIIKMDSIAYIQNTLISKDIYWKIDLTNTPNAKKCIRFYFRSMDIAAGHSLQIYDSTETDMTFGESFGSSTPPLPFQIWGKTAVIRFTTPSVTIAQGFEIQYAHVDCSSRIRITNLDLVVVGSPTSLQWTCTGNTDRIVDVYLRQDGLNIRQIGSNVTCSAGSLSWNVGVEIPEGNRYSYNIVARDAISINQVSSLFTITVLPKFLHVSPLTLIKPSTTRIYWTHNGLQEGNFVFKLRNSVTGAEPYQLPINNVGYFDFPVPSPPSNFACDYDLVIDLASSTTLTTLASLNVYICKVDQPDIRVITPSFFPLNVGSKQIVQYYSYKVKSVDVYLKENDEALTTITKLANNTSPVGYLTVDIPSTLTLGRNYIVSVEDALVLGGAANSSFHFTAVQKKCDYSITGTSGNITLPSFSSGFNWDSCQWQITNPCGSNIRFYLGYLGNIASCDTLNVYDGTNTNATLLGSYLGSNGVPLDTIVSTGPNLLVKWQACQYVTAPTTTVLSSVIRGYYSSVQCRGQVTGILSPSRISNVVVGTPYKIKWLAQAEVSFVKVELIQNNLVVSIISANTTGSEIMWSPAVSGASYKIRVSNLVSLSNVIESAFFDVRTGVWSSSMAVSSPSTIKQATNYTLLLNNTQVVNVDLYRGSEYVTRLARDVNGNQTTVTIPWVQQSEYYRFIVSDSFTGRYVESDTFSITPNTPTITVKPTFGFITQNILHNPSWSGLESEFSYTNNLINGNSYYIKWSYNGPVVDDTNDVEVRIISEGIVLSSLSVNANQNYLLWAVPSETASGYGKHDKYQVLVTSVRNRLIYGYGPIFTISPSTTLSVCPPVTLGDQIALTLSPQSFEAGSIIPITWTSIGAIPYVTITIETGSGATIASLGEGCIPNNQLFNWVVPSNLNGNYVVRISGVNTTVPATQNTYPGLTIKGVPTVYTFTSPLANARWASNETRTVSWDNLASSSLAIPSDVRLFANGILISNTSTSETVPNTGSYLWDITKYVKVLGNAAYVNNFTLTITGTTQYQGTTYTVNGKSGVFFINGVKLNAASGMTGFVSLTIICSLIALFFA